MSALWTDEIYGERQLVASSYGHVIVYQRQSRRVVHVDCDCPWCKDVLEPTSEGGA